MRQLSLCHLTVVCGILLGVMPIGVVFGEEPAPASSLVEKGSPQAVIVHGPAPDPIERTAIEKLQAAILRDGGPQARLARAARSEPEQPHAFWSAQPPAIRTSRRWPPGTICRWGKSGPRAFSCGL